MRPRFEFLRKALTVLTAILLVKVTASVVWGYRSYLPPDFRADFLQGREAYFWNGYHAAFYTHLISGPLSLVLGMVLMSETFRQRFPLWHRRLGRMQGMVVLLLLAPSGLWMAWYAATGTIAAMGFASLSIATAACIALGWRSAVSRRFGDHRVWMQRAFVLLCSAVVIRMIGGLATVLGLDIVWLYPANAWASWLAPLGMLEWSRRWFKEARSVSEGLSVFA